MQKLKKLKYKIWNEPNPEGLRGKDIFFLFVFFFTFYFVMSNLVLWLDKPEQEWIKYVIYPMAK